MSSTNHDRPTAGELVPVKFSRLTRRGVLLGLSLTQLITLAIGGATLIGAFYAGGGMLLAYTAPIWVLAAMLTWRLLLRMLWAAFQAHRLHAPGDAHRRCREAR